MDPPDLVAHIPSRDLAREYVPPPKPFIVHINVICLLSVLCHPMGRSRTLIPRRARTCITLTLWDNLEFSNPKAYLSLPPYLRVAVGSSISHRIAIFRASVSGFMFSLSVILPLYTSVLWLGFSEACNYRFLNCHFGSSSNQPHTPLQASLRRIDSHPPTPECCGVSKVSC